MSRTQKKENQHTLTNVMLFNSAHLTLSHLGLSYSVFKILLAIKDSGLSIVSALACHISWNRKGSSTSRLCNIESFWNWEIGDQSRTTSFKLRHQAAAHKLVLSCKCIIHKKGLTHAYVMLTSTPLVGWTCASFWGDLQCATSHSGTRHFVVLLRLQ